MRVIVESPFKNSDIKIACENIIYANMVARHLTIECSYSPLFFHTFYTQFLDDNNNEERDIGLTSSFTHHDRINKRIVAIDRGISEGMKLGVERGLEIGCMPVILSLSKDRGLQKAIRHINEVVCPIRRWEEIKSFCEVWVSCDELGSVTNYLDDRNDLRDDVVKVLSRSILPMAEYLEQ